MLWALELRSNLKNEHYLRLLVALMFRACVRADAATDRCCAVEFVFRRTALALLATRADVCSLLCFLMVAMGPPLVYWDVPAYKAVPQE